MQSHVHGVREMEKVPRWHLSTAAAHRPAHDDELALCGLRPDASPDVHGEQGAAAVKDGGQRRHEGGQHHSQHQTSQTCTHTERQQDGRRRGSWLERPEGDEKCK